MMHTHRVRFGNRCVIALLRSPLHRLLSGSTDAIRYTGRRSGRMITTPTQYARHAGDIVILVGRPEHPRAARSLGAGAPGAQLRRVVLVRCRPAQESPTGG